MTEMFQSGELQKLVKVTDCKSTLAQLPKQESLDLSASSLLSMKKKIDSDFENKWGCLWIK